MSDMTITQEQRAEIRRIAASKSFITFKYDINDKLTRLLNALEQAEARAERAESAQLHLCQWLSDIAVELGCACDNEAMLLAAHDIKARAEKEEAEDARQIMISKALARKLAQATRTWGKAGNMDNSAGYWMAWAEHDADSEIKAARRAVAAGEETCQK